MSISVLLFNAFACELQFLLNCVEEGVQEVELVARVGWHFLKFNAWTIFISVLEFGNCHWDFSKG